MRRYCLFIYFFRRYFIIFNFKRDVFYSVSYFNPAGSTVGGIHYGSNGSWPIFRRNHFESIGGAPCIYVWGSGHAGGLIKDNIFMLAADAAGSAITTGANATRYMILNNVANDATVGAISANPFTEGPGTNVWATDWSAKIVALPLLTDWD